MINFNTLKPGIGFNIPCMVSVNGWSLVCDGYSIIRCDRKTNVQKKRKDVNSTKAEEMEKETKCQIIMFDKFQQSWVWTIATGFVSEFNLSIGSFIVQI